jgi:hypothetical protein
MLRECDEAVLRDLAALTLRTKSGAMKEVPKVFATPDRAFEQWLKEHPTNPDGSKRDINDVTLPIISVTRITDGDFDPERFRFTQYRYGYTDRFRNILVAQHPTPYTITYQIDLWTKRARHMNQMLEQFLRSFVGDMRIIWVERWDSGSDYRDYEIVVPTYPSEVYFESIADNSDLEPGEDKNRVIRKTITVRMNAWLFKDAELKRTVQKVGINYRDGEGNLLDSDEFDEDALL